MSTVNHEPPHPDSSPLHPNWPNPFRIAHLSDIHFGSDFNHHQWSYVKAVLQDQAPNLVVVTGDFVQHPWPLMLTLARKEMLDLSKRLDVRVLTIPGNHDVGIFGSAHIWPLNKLYAPIFAEVNDEKIRSLFPSFSEFHNKKAFKRFFLTFKLYMRFFQWYFGHGLGSPYPRNTAPIHTDVGPLWMVAFDSNRSGFLASGKVSEDQIFDFATKALVLSNPQTFKDALQPRIALIHHHLIPIPYAVEDISGVEAFLVLRNAGTILKELCKHDFDLALHGHRHMACFSRVAYGDQTVDAKQLAVLSAASPTVREKAAGFNSMHLIDLHRNGRIEIREHRFGGGMSIQNPQAAQGGRIRVQSIPELKSRNYNRAVTIQSQSCDEYAREILIDDAGTSVCRTILTSLRVPPGKELSKHMVRVWVDRGSLDPATFHRIDTDGRWSTQCSIRSIKEEPQTVEHEITFSPPITERSEVNYAIEYTTDDNFATTRWEAELSQQTPHGSMEMRSGTHQAVETTAVRVRIPIRKLRIRLELPRSLVDSTPYVRCYMPSEYPELEMDDRTREVHPPKNFSSDSDRWSPDGEMSDYEGSFLTKLSDRTWEWCVSYPLVGYLYQLNWSVEDVREIFMDPIVIGQTAKTRKMFLNYGAKFHGKAPATTAPQTRKWLTTELLGPLYNLFKDTIAGNDEFRLSIFAFDEAENNLVAIEEVATPGATNIFDTPGEGLKLRFGEGVAGLTFKRCTATVYYRPEADRPSGGGLSRLFSAADRLNLKAVVGIPLFYPDAWRRLLTKKAMNIPVEPEDFPSIQECIGVLALASDSEATGLAKFIGKENKELLKLQGDIINYMPELIEQIRIDTTSSA